MMTIDWQEVAMTVIKKISTYSPELPKFKDKSTRYDFCISASSAFDVRIKNGMPKYKWIWECELPEHLSDHWNNNKLSLLKDGFIYYSRNRMVWLLIDKHHYSNFVSICEKAENLEVSIDALSEVIAKIIKSAYDTLIVRGRHYLKLTSLKISNFRSYMDDNTVYFDRLTTFIGENDSGKTSLLLAVFYYLKALRLFANNENMRGRIIEDKKFFQPLLRSSDESMSKSMFYDKAKPIILHGSFMVVNTEETKHEIENNQIPITILFYYKKESDGFELELVDGKNLANYKDKFKHINPIYLDSTVKTIPSEERDADGQIKEKLLAAEYGSVFKNLLNRAATNLKDNNFLSILGIKDIQNDDSDERYVSLSVSNFETDKTFFFDDIGQGYKDLLLFLSVTNFLSPLGSSFLLIDEQGLHLHPSMKVKFAEILQKIADDYENIQIVYTTHDPKLIPYNSDSLSMVKIEKSKNFSKVAKVDEVEDAYRFLETAGYFEIVSQYANQIRKNKKIMFVEGISDKKYLNLIIDCLKNNKYPTPYFLPSKFEDYTIISIQGVEGISAIGSILTTISYILGSKITFDETKAFVRELFENCWILLDADYSVFKDDRNNYEQFVVEEIKKTSVHYVKNEVDMLNIKILDCYAIENLFLADKDIRSALYEFKSNNIVKIEEDKTKERVNYFLENNISEIETLISHDYNKKGKKLSQEDLKKITKYCIDNPFKSLNPKKYLLPSMLLSENAFNKFKNKETNKTDNVAKKKTEISKMSDDFLRSIKIIFKNPEQEERLELFFNNLQSGAKK